MKLGKVQNAVFPLIRRERLICWGLWLTIGSKVFVFLKPWPIIFIYEVECACSILVPKFPLSKGLCFFIQDLFTFLRQDGFLNLLLYFLVVSCLSKLLIFLIGMNRGKSEFHISLKVFTLDQLPLGSVVSNCALSKLDLFSSEFTILTKGIEADHELDSLSLERLGLDVIPSSLGCQLIRIE